jgi:hypothetical protein
MTVDEAELRISAILAELEKEHGATVRNLRLCINEVTTIDSDRKKFYIGARIELERMPGHMWEGVK